MGIEIRLLGPVAVEREETPLALAGPKQRIVLALLASRPGVVISGDRLVEALWGARPPKTAATALHGHVSRLRRLLAQDVIATRPPGYALELPPEAVDATRFERLVTRARGEPPAQRAATLAEALGLWRGAAFADVVGVSMLLHEEAQRLDELRLLAQEDLFEAKLDLGNHVEIVPELESLVRTDPLRERTVGQLMLALYRAGRQVDALDVYRGFRHDLNERLGLEPEQSLRELERRILAQDPALAPTAGRRAEHGRRLPLTAAAVALELAGATDVDAETYARLTAQAREVVRLVLERHGATVERAGSAVVGLFGSPLPHEDDAARAIDASRAALASVEELAGRMRAAVRVVARAGVASDEVFHGESPAIENALRLAAAQSPGWLAVDDTTRARARTREQRTDRPLAGRERERQLLRTRYDDAVRERRSVFVPLVGPAGIGKSRLAHDLLAAVAPPARVLRGRCLSYGDGIGLLPAAELVRSALDVPADDLTAGVARERLTALLAGDERAAGGVEQLLGLLGLGEGPGEDGAGWAVRRLLERLAERDPVVALVEDLHWATPAFLELLAPLVEPADVPLVVLATARELPEGSRAGEPLRLAPLGDDACAAIVTDLLGGEVDAAALADLLERSGGNPLYLEELVADARASGRLRRERGTWRLEESGGARPPSLQSLLAMRVEHLPDAERDLLSRASVLGKSFTHSALADLAGDHGEALDALVAEGLLQPATAAGDDLEFRHLLIREAAYASLSLELRAELHARHAAWLDRRPVAPARPRDVFAVYHLDRAFRAREALTPGAPELVDARAALVARTSALGRAFLARGDSRAAVAPLARALELDRADPLLAVELGRAQLDAGDLPASAEAFALATDGPLAERAHLGRLEVQLHTDAAVDLDAAGREIGELLATLRESGDVEGEVEALVASAYLALARGRAAEAGPTLEDALALTRRAGRSRAEAEILFLICGSCWYGPSPVADGVRRCERVLAEAAERPPVEAAALQALAVQHAMLAEYDRARELVRSAQAIWRDIGRSVATAATAIDVGLVELLAGEHAVAEEALREGYAELERLGEKGYFSTVAALLAAAVEAQGRTATARELAQAAAAAATEGDAVSQVGWRTTEARVLAAVGKHAEAQRIADEAVALADATDFSLVRGDAWSALAAVAAARGDGEAAAAARATAVDVLAAKGLAAPAIDAWARLSRRS